MIEAISYKERKFEKQKLLSLLSEKKLKEYEQDQKSALEEEIEKNRLEEKFKKIIIEDAVNQNICTEDDRVLELPIEAEILLPFSFYKCVNLEAACIHDNIRVCAKETFHETDDDLADEVIVPEGVIEIAPLHFTRAFWF